MRARRRRSVLNTVSAAALEIFIMGIFVIIAQPQLRDALFELLQVDPAHAAATSAGRPAQPAVTNPPATPAVGMDRTVEAVRNSRVGQAIESSLTQWANDKWSSDRRPEVNIPSLSTQPFAQPLTQSQPAPMQFLPSSPSLLPSTSIPSTTGMSANNSWGQQTVTNQVAGYSPYEQYESLRVSIPNDTQVAYPQQYVPSPNYASQNYAAPQYSAPTQLGANQWNVASASQSQRPDVHAQNNHWIPNQVTETSFRQVYPPPYGTQSMWK